MGLYFRGQVVVCLLVGVLMAAGFALIGLPLGIVLGLLIGGAEHRPPTWAWRGAVPVLFLAGLNSLEAGESVWVGIGLAVAVMAVVQVIQDVVLVPQNPGREPGAVPLAPSSSPCPCGASCSASSACSLPCP